MGGNQRVEGFCNKLKRTVGLWPDGEKGGHACPLVEVCGRRGRHKVKIAEGVIVSCRRETIDQNRKRYVANHRTTILELV